MERLGTHSDLLRLCPFGLDARSSGSDCTRGTAVFGGVVAGDSSGGLKLTWGMASVEERVPRPEGDSIIGMLSTLVSSVSGRRIPVTYFMKEAIAR